MATLAHPVAVGEHIGTRLAAATVAHRDAREIAEKAAAKWRKLIVEAIDAGMRQQDVAAISGVSRARLHAILVTEYTRA